MQNCYKVFDVFDIGCCLPNFQTYTLHKVEINFKDAKDLRGAWLLHQPTV
jgi:hypothetical protein